MKCDTFANAIEKAILVKNIKGENIGKLIPVGKWILDDREKIELISAWRKRSMRMFMVQFKSTYERTYKYLSSLSIEDKRRLFFLIFDKDSRFIGHIGISNTTEKSFELDNLMRGEYGGDPQLIYQSEVALLNWSFTNLEALYSTVRVLSYNWMVIGLHEEIGYVVKDRKRLLRQENDSEITHSICPDYKTNVDYACLLMRLDKGKFKSLNKLRE